jgi:hypothetical protein
MTEFFQTIAEGAGFFTIVEEGQGCKLLERTSPMIWLWIWMAAPLADGSGLVGSCGLEGSRG